MAERSNAPDFVASAANDESSGPAPALITVLGRDVLLLVALTLWAAADAWHIVSEMPFAGALAVADAVLAGLLLASLTHEWGHYAGAQWTKADAPLVRPTTFSLFRYNYNFDANEPRQFQVMSVASHVATLALIVAFASMLTFATPSQIAFFCALAAFAVFAAVTEFPVIYNVAQGEQPLHALSHIDRQLLVRNGFIGAVAGLVLFAIID